MWSIIAFLALVFMGYWAWIHSGVFKDHPQADFTSGLFGGLIGAAFTLILAILGWLQLASLADTTRQDSERATADSRRASASFIMDLKRDFFQEETRMLITLLANRWLRFVDRYEDGEEAQIPYFAIDRSFIASSRLTEDIKRKLLAREAYTAFEIDDLLLGHLADLAMLWERGVLDFRMIEAMFGWYVTVAWEDGQIKKYIFHQRQTESQDMYRDFERLADMIRWSPDVVWETSSRVK